MHFISKLIKIYEKSNVQRVTQNSQDTTKSYKKQPPYPLCNAQCTMYKAQLYFMQLTIVYHLKFKGLPNRDIPGINHNKH